MKKFKLLFIQIICLMIIWQNELHKKLEFANDVIKRCNLGLFSLKKNRQSNTVTLPFTIDSPISYLSFFFYFSRNGFAIQEINVYIHI